MTIPSDWWPCLELAGLLALEAALIVALAAVLQRSIRSVLWHRAIWHAAVIGLLAIALLEFSGLPAGVAAWSGSWLREHWAARRPATSSTGPGSKHAELASLTPDFQKEVEARLALNRRLLAAGVAQASRPLAGPSGNRVPSSSDAGDQDIEPYLTEHDLPWPEIVWGIGTVAVLGPIALARLFFWLVGQRRRPVFDGALLQRVAEMARRVGLRRRVRVFESPRLAGPVAFGLIRPTIGLPEQFSARHTARQQEVILAHELAHLASHDPLWQWLADGAAALLWWHPLVWWARNRLRATAETAADEASLLVADGPGVLAECLLQLASQAAGSRPRGEFAMTGGGFRSGLGRRIERLVNLKHGSWSPLGPVRSCAAKVLGPVAVATAAVLCAAWVSPQQSWKGEPMKVITRTWKRSVATFALFAAVAAEPGQAQVNPAESGAPDSNAQPAPATEGAPPTATGADATRLANGQANPALLIKDATALQEAGKLDEAEAKLQDVLKIAPQNKRAARLLSLIQQQRSDRALRDRFGGTTAPAADPSTKGPEASNTPAVTEPPAAAQPGAGPDGVSRYRMDPRLAARYGLLPKGPALEEADPNTTPSSQPAPATNYRMDPRLAARYGLTAAPQAQPGPAPERSARYGVPTPAAALPAAPPAGVPDQPGDASAPGEPAKALRLDRYGRQWIEATPPGPAQLSRGKQQIEAKLNQIILQDSLYDGLPLSEVVRDLNEQALRRDPEKKGINFIISNVAETPAPTGIDPTNGQPLPPPAAIELGAVIIRLHLRHVSLKDIIDAMTKVSEQPIRYSIEDYGVVFSPGPAQPQPVSAPLANRLAAVPFQVRIFHVDTNTFFAGLESAFGVTVPHSGGSGISREAAQGLYANLAKAEDNLKRAQKLSEAKSVSEADVEKARRDFDLAQDELRSFKDKERSQAITPRDVQQALRQLLNQLGIDMSFGNKAVFYNDLTGIVMVRATADDLEIVQAAIETLGGKALRTSLERTPTVSFVGKGVNKEGAVELPDGQRISLLEAIARAGGFSPAANKHKIEVSHHGQMTSYKFDDLKKPDREVWLEAGDMVYVSETFF
jgi:beta-lactamase regulating signal transducer with metallopeptidase domain